MAQYKVLDPEQEVICPYDPNHRPRARGIQSHLINCRKNNPHMKLEICQFNATHHVPRSEYRHHLMNCPDKAMMELEFRYEARAGQVLGGCTQVPVYQDMNIPSSEDWDAEARAGQVLGGCTQVPVYQDMNIPSSEDWDAEARAGQVLGGCTQVPVYQDMNIPSSEDWDAEARAGQVLGGCTQVPVYQDMNIPSSEDWDAEARAGQVLGGCTQVPVYQNMNIPSSEDWDADVQDVTNTFNGIILHRSGNQPRQQPISYNCGLNQTYNKSGKQATSFDTSPQQPRFQPVEQPVSSIYAYSVSRGRGRGRGRGRRIEQTEQDAFCNTENSFGRGGGAGPSLVSAQLGSTVPFPKGLVEKRF